MPIWTPITRWIVSDLKPLLSMIAREDLCADGVAYLLRIESL